MAKINEPHADHPGTSIAPKLDWNRPLIGAGAHMAVDFEERGRFSTPSHDYRADAATPRPRLACSGPGRPCLLFRQQQHPPIRPSNRESANGARRTR